MHHYQHHAELEIIVQTGEERDARIDRLLGRIGAAISAGRILRGRCDWAEAEAPEPVDLPVEGSATLKAAIIPIVPCYATHSPLS